MKAEQVILEIKKGGNRKRAEISARFFKTGIGQYGEGDIFWGLTVPQTRLIARGCLGLTLIEIKKLLSHTVHEVRLVGSLILVEQYEAADEVRQEKIKDFFLANAKRFNNWDLVDLTAPKILGHYLVDHKNERKILFKLVKSSNLWERRIAIVSTLTLIKNGEFSETLKLVGDLINDKQDLIHKACGWMLREIYKQQSQVLIKYLDQWAVKLPRTTLRYAIERMSPAQRKHYLLLK